MTYPDLLKSWAMISLPQLVQCSITSARLKAKLCCSPFIVANQRQISPTPAFRQQQIFNNVRDLRADRQSGSGQFELIRIRSLQRKSRKSIGQSTPLHATAHQRLTLFRFFPLRLCCNMLQNMSVHTASTKLTTIRTCSFLLAFHDGADADKGVARYSVRTRIIMAEWISRIIIHPIPAL
jgi:hypothetical protein